MLALRPVAAALGLPNQHFNTVGNILLVPLELALILGVPALRSMVLAGLRHPFPWQARVEAAALSTVKVSLTFGVWGAVALWGMHVSQRSPDVQHYGFLFDRHLRDAHYFSTWGLVHALFAITLGPFIEELVFRGVLFRLWEQQWGWTAGALLSAAVFSAIHPHNLIQTFLSAVLYACLYRRTGSLWATTLCHSFYNLLVTWPLFGHLLILKPPEAATSIVPWIPNLICLAIGSIAAVLYIALAARKPAAHGHVHSTLPH